MHLMPLYMHMYAEKRAWHELEGYNIMDCMECGSCNYICPAASTWCSPSGWPSLRSAVWRPSKKQRRGKHEPGIS